MKIFVKKLSTKTTEHTLRTQFEKFGAVSSVTIVMDEKTKRSKGFGFVVMHSEKDGNAAINGLQKYKIDGKLISAKEAGATMAPTPRKPDSAYEKKPYKREDSKKKSYSREDSKKKPYNKDDSKKKSYKKDDSKKKSYSREDSKKKNSTSYEKKDSDRPKKTYGRDDSKKRSDRSGSPSNKKKPFFKKK